MKKLIICIAIMISMVASGCSVKTESVSSTNDEAKGEKITTSEVTTEETTTDEVVTEEITSEEITLEVTTEQNESDCKSAEDILLEMTLEEKVAQMFIGRCPEENAVLLAQEYQLGGYILFARDFDGKSKEDVISNINSYQEVSKVPMFIGVDEEGGTVNRVSKYKTFRSVPFWAPQDLYKEGGMPLIVSDTVEKSRLLKSLGINLNFAPVADVSTSSSDFIYYRTFGQDAEATATYVENIVETMQNEKIGSVIKHFPGYGNNEDTHTGIAYDYRSYESFVNCDFIPFKAGINKGVSMVLVAHNVVFCMDENKPASLSENIHRVLRDELGYDGVIITDDLSMEGAKAFAENEDIAVLAIKAGNDLLCTTDFEAQINSVIQAVKEGAITEERIDKSVLRILKLKMELDIINTGA